MKPNIMHSSRSQDINPVIYIWDIIQQQVYKTKCAECEYFEQHLIDVWAGVEQSVIVDVIA